MTLPHWAPWAVLAGLAALPVFLAFVAVWVASGVARARRQGEP